LFRQSQKKQKESNLLIGCWVFTLPKYKYALLYKATQELPIGTAYAVWTGIGAVGTVLVGIVVFKEPATLENFLF
jgi:quaternary ammonium compound-resistance protein SugE